MPAQSAAPVRNTASIKGASRPMRVITAISCGCQSGCLAVKSSTVCPAPAIFAGGQAETMYRAVARVDASHTFRRHFQVLISVCRAQSVSRSAFFKHFYVSPYFHLFKKVEKSRPACPMRRAWILPELNRSPLPWGFAPLRWRCPNTSCSDWGEHETHRNVRQLVQKLAYIAHRKCWTRNNVGQLISSNAASSFPTIATARRACSHVEVTLQFGYCRFRRRFKTEPPALPPLRLSTWGRDTRYCRICPQAVLQAGICWSAAALIVLQQIPHIFTFCCIPECFHCGTNPAAGAAHDFGCKRVEFWISESVFSSLLPGQSDGRLNDTCRHAQIAGEAGTR